MNDIELRKIASKLLPIVENGNCIVWVGSGLSKIAGYPGWQKTIEELCLKCGIPLLDKFEEESAELLIDKAEECKSVNRNIYHSTLANLFGKRVTSTRVAFQLLMKLPFKAYITTNFDPLLSVAGAMVGYNDLYSYPDIPIDVLGKNSHPIFYIHGLARIENQANGENLVLARSDFDEAYENIGIVKNFITYIFAYYPILFLGCSLTEPEMYAAFQKVHNIHARIQRAYPSAHLPERYILLPIRQKRIRSGFPDEKIERDYKMEQKEINRFKDMKIEVIRYETDDWYNHGEIEDVLGHICTLKKLYMPPIPRMSFEEEGPL